MDSDKGKISVGSAGVDQLNSYTLSYCYAIARGLSEYYLRPYIWPTEGSISEIEPGLYVGDVTAAHNRSLLQKHGITHVVSAVLGLPFPYPQEFTYHYAPLRDSVHESLEEHLIPAIDFISRAIAGGGKVLVHCMKGASRSVSIAAAYLMHTHHIDADKAIRRIQDARPVANPNDSFRKQLTTKPELHSLEQ